MSDQATGGDGSVRWSITADSVKELQSNHAKDGRLLHEGIDKTGTPGDWFTVSVKVPNRFRTVESYLRALRGDDPLWGIKPDPNGNQKRVEFNIKIERMTPAQVRVSWGDSEYVHRPKIAARARKKVAPKRKRA
jgi:hypothetical protein